jgi:type I thyroxine 5'-deiodinase
VEGIHKKYGDRVEFLTLYIKEAHPLDEWQMDSNVTEGVCYPQPTTLDDRMRIANDFVKRFDYKIPLVVDPIENPANKAYAGWPERFYIVDESGMIVYKGKPGPFGYHPEEVEAWLSKRFPDVTAPSSAGS